MPHTTASTQSATAQQQPRYKLGIVFTLNTFIIIAVLLCSVSAIGAGSVIFEIVSLNFWTHPAIITIITLLVCALLSSAILVMANNLVFRPIQSMNKGLEKLAQGDFNVRMTSENRVNIQEIDNFITEFNATAAQLGEVELLRTGFIEDFSHEFKTPINSINGFAQLLQEDDLTEEERREYASIIAEESKRLASLSDTLLTLRKVESQSTLTRTEPIDIVNQLQQRATITQQAWAEKNVTFDVKCAHSAPIVCPGDEALLERAWSNLFDNAAKFCTEESCVRVYCRPTESQAIVRICNEGPAIPPATQRRIFDRFYQADSSHATKGNGLGLPLVKRIIELHDGTITVTSDENETCFEVRLPL